MTVRHQIAALLEPLTLPPDYLQVSMRRSIDEITARIPYHYMNTVRRHGNQNQTIQAVVAPQAGTTTNAAPPQVTGPQDHPIPPLTDQENEDEAAELA
jgi:hypothetical protein